LLETKKFPFDDNTIIFMDAPHTSFDMNLGYMDNKLFNKMTNAMGEDEKKKNDTEKSIL